MTEYKKCCPKHPEAKHLRLIEWTRYPDIFDKGEFWWVWSCQHMEPPFDGAPPIRCGYMHHIKKYLGRPLDWEGENND